jgi:hypothetical protein
MSLARSLRCSPCTPTVPSCLELALSCLSGMVPPYCQRPWPVPEDRPTPHPTRPVDAAHPRTGPSGCQVGLASSPSCPAGHMPVSRGLPDDERHPLTPFGACQQPPPTNFLSPQSPSDRARSVQQHCGVRPSGYDPSVGCPARQRSGGPHVPTDTPTLPPIQPLAVCHTVPHGPLPAPHLGTHSTHAEYSRSTC